MNKQCTHCKRALPADDAHFYRTGRPNRSGVKPLAGMCRDCYDADRNARRNPHGNRRGRPSDHMPTYTARVEICEDDGLVRHFANGKTTVVSFLNFKRLQTVDDIVKVYQAMHYRVVRASGQKTIMEKVEARS